MYIIVVTDCDSDLKRTFKDDSIFDFESVQNAVISRIPDFAKSRLEYSYRGECILTKSFVDSHYVIVNVFCK